MIRRVWVALEMEMWKEGDTGSGTNSPHSVMTFSRPCGHRNRNLYGKMRPSDGLKRVKLNIIYNRLFCNKKQLWLCFTQVINWRQWNTHELDVKLCGAWRSQYDHNREGNFMNYWLLSTLDYTKHGTELPLVLRPPPWAPPQVSSTNHQFNRV